MPEMLLKAADWALCITQRPW